jgi:hypothetical protein
VHLPPLFSMQALAQPAHLRNDGPILATTCIVGKPPEAARQFGVISSL